MPPCQLVIYGTRGVAREMHQVARDLAASGEDIVCKGFLVDREYAEVSIVHGLPVLGDAGWLVDNPDVSVVIGIGDTPPRARIAQRIAKESGARFVTLKHPRSHVGSDVAIADGCFVAAGASATTDISIGSHSQLHAGCTVGHDTVLGDFVTIAPGANISGRVTIGDGVFVGAGAVVLPDIKIGSWTVVGAGAVVTRDVPANVTLVGVPARVISERHPGWHLDSK